MRSDLQTVIWLILLSAGLAPSVAHADHPPAPAPQTSIPLPSQGLQSPIGPPLEAGFGLRVSVLHLAESPSRSYDSPIPDAPQTYIAQELYGRLNVHRNLALMTSLPLWTRLGADGGTGLGDSRVGLVAAHCTGHHGGHMVAGHFEVTLPTGRESLGFGYRSWAGRLLAGYRYSEPRWALAFQTGVGYSWHEGSGVIGEYDLSFIRQLGERWTFATGLAGATHLTAGTSSGPSQPTSWQRAGHSSLRTHASVHFAVNRSLSLHGELQVPITSWADSPFTGSFGAEFRFPHRAR